MQSNRVPLDGTRAGPLDRALDLLDVLADTPHPPTLSALAARLALPKSTVHRLLAQLASRGAVVREGEGYAPGPLLARLGRAASRVPTLEAAAAPVMEALARETGETVFVVAPRGGRLVVVAKHEGRGFLRTSPELGAEVPLHATSAGRLHLGLAPERVALPKGRLEAYTPKTPRTRAALDAAVARAVARGWDENVDEWIDGLSVLSAAIRPTGRPLVGALSLSCTSARYAALGGAARAPELVSAAAQVAARLSETPA